MARKDLLRSMMLHLKYPVIKFKIRYSLGFEFLRRSCHLAQEEQFRTVPILLWVPFGWDKDLSTSHFLGRWPQEASGKAWRKWDRGGRKSVRGVSWSRLPLWATRPHFSQGPLGPSVEHGFEFSTWRNRKAGAFIHQSLVCQLAEGYFQGRELLRTLVCLACTHSHGRWVAGLALGRPWCVEVHGQGTASISHGANPNCQLSNSPVAISN